MRQNHFAINAARRYDETFGVKPRFIHYCLIEKPCADLITPGSLNDFVAELRIAFAAIGEFKITVTRWKYSGEAIDG